MLETAGIVIRPFTKRINARTGEQVSSCRIIRPGQQRRLQAINHLQLHAAPRRSTLISKFSKRTAALAVASVRLPELRTASEQLRNKADTGRYWPCVSACPLPVATTYPLSQAANMCNWQLLMGRNTPLLPITIAPSLMTFTTFAMRNPARKIDSVNTIVALSALPPVAGAKSVLLRRDYVQPAAAGIARA